MRGAGTPLGKASSTRSVYPPLKPCSAPNTSHSTAPLPSLVRVEAAASPAGSRASAWLMAAATVRL
ncbi:MAG: hypothetical protein R3E55_06515 [Burkholderiaceae bacterium]